MVKDSWINFFVCLPQGKTGTIFWRLLHFIQPRKMNLQMTFKIKCLCISVCLVIYIFLFFYLMLLWIVAFWFHSFGLGCKYLKSLSTFNIKDKCFCYWKKFDGRIFSTWVEFNWQIERKQFPLDAIDICLNIWGTCFMLYVEIWIHLDCSRSNYLHSQCNDFLEMCSAFISAAIRHSVT